MLYADGKVLWSNVKDIPNEFLYHMGELITDTMQHKQKVIGDKQNRSRTFLITSEGGGKMHHIIVYLMLCTNSMWLIVVCVNFHVGCLCELLHVRYLTD